MGGHDGLSIFDSVERYDHQANAWTRVTPMLNRRCRLGVATLNEKLYACGGYDGNSFLKRFISLSTLILYSEQFSQPCYASFKLNFSVEEYDPEKDEWRLVAPMNVKRSRVALCANMGKLWAIGGNFRWTFFLTKTLFCKVQLILWKFNPVFSRKYILNQIVCEKIKFNMFLIL